MVNSVLKNTQRYFCGMHGTSYWGYIEETEEKYDTFCTFPSGDYQIVTSAKLLDIMCQSYGFSSDLIETVN